jgi:DNA-binding transcriptional LysR family regulator
VVLVPAHQGELLARLREGTIAVAITYDLGLNPGVEFTPLAPAPPYALVPADHRLAGAESAELAELADDPFLLLDLPLSRNYFLGIFRAAALEPVVARRVADPELLRSLVAWGYGYTLANARPEPERAVDGTPLRALPLHGGPAPPRVGLARRAGLEPTRTATAFADTCADVLGTRWGQG